MMYSSKKTIKEINVKDKSVLLRCDFNVPLDENGNITDYKRIDESLKTIKYLLSQNSKVILCSHLGRPKEKFNSKLSLKPVAKFLESILSQKIIFIYDILSPQAKSTVSTAENGDIVLLENLRFYKGETANDESFAKVLASFADVFVNDAFGTCHRSHASTVGITKYLPSVCGFLVERELDVIFNTLNDPKRPFIAILGGAKVSDKIGVIKSLLDKVDVLIIGGGMSYTFTNALGYSVGQSIFESDKVEFAKDMMAKAKENDVKILLPVDNKVGKEFSPNTEFEIVRADKIPEGFMGLDIGPESEKMFCEVIKSAGTIFWNGPLGVFEWNNFSNGTRSVAEAIAESNAVSIIGGGDSAAAAQKFGLSNKFTHVSTGGGASLKLIEGEPLPGIDALDDKQY